MMPSRRLTSYSLLVFLTVLGPISISYGQADEKAQLARLMFSAFQCGAYAAMSDNEKEKARLFEVGVKAGREFLDAVNNGQITYEAEWKVLPAAVVERLAYRPSTEFVLGRIFEYSTNAAHDMATVAHTDFLTKQELTKNKAKEKYFTGNCALLK
jgi:hypothetical protein